VIILNATKDDKECDDRSQDKSCESVDT